MTASYLEIRGIGECGDIGEPVICQSILATSCQVIHIFAIFPMRIELRVVQTDEVRQACTLFAHFHGNLADVFTNCQHCSPRIEILHYQIQRDDHPLSITSFCPAVILDLDWNSKPRTRGGMSTNEPSDEHFYKLIKKSHNQAAKYILTAYFGQFIPAAAVTKQLAAPGHEPRCT